MNCPRCRDDLRRADRSGVEIDFCPRCRGVWLDGGELEKLLERSQGYVPAPGYAPTQDMGNAGYQQAPAREVYRDDHRRDEHYRDDHRRDDHRRDDHRYDSHGHGHHKKKKGFLGEIFDIFD